MLPARRYYVSAAVTAGGRPNRDLRVGSRNSPRLVRCSVSPFAESIVAAWMVFIAAIAMDRDAAIDAMRPTGSRRPEYSFPGVMYVDCSVHNPEVENY